MDTMATAMVITQQQLLFLVHVDSGAMIPMCMLLMLEMDEFVRFTCTMLGLSFLLAVPQISLVPSPLLILRSLLLNPVGNHHDSQRCNPLANPQGSQRLSLRDSLRLNLHCNPQDSQREGLRVSHRVLPPVNHLVLLLANQVFSPLVSLQASL